MKQNTDESKRMYFLKNYRQEIAEKRKADDTRKTRSQKLKLILAFTI